MLSDPEFRMILDYFNRPWKGYRKVRKGVKKRIRRHMQALGCKGVRDYLSIISKDPDRERTAAACLLVTISRFFRDRGVWAYIGETVLPGLAAGAPDRIRAWSAGCACGEEAYSLSILWHRLALPGMELDILGTDVNPDCLARAMTGRYGRSSLKAVDDPTLAACFKKVSGSRQYEIRSCIRTPVRWRIHDLLTPLSGGPFHIIMLRNNLLTYHRGKALEDGFRLVLERFLPGGFLVIGNHERLPDGFEGVFEQVFLSVYRYIP